MQKRIIKKNGKTYVVNVPTWGDGVGPGFPVGKMVFKSGTDRFWYVISTSGLPGSVVPAVSQSVLSFPTTSYYDQNYPYQLLKASNGFAYQLYLDGTAPTAALVVSQSAWSGSVGMETPKPSLLLQNSTDGQFYNLYLSSSGATITIQVDQVPVSASWINF